MTVFSVALTLVLIQLCICQPADPGFNTAITQSGLDYLSSIGDQLLVQQLQTVTVPDQSGDANAPIIGSVAWSLTGIAVESATIGSSTIVFNPGSGLTLTMSNINVNMDSNWSYRQDDWPNISDSGSAVVMVEDTTIVVTFSVTTSAGRPYLTVTSDNINISNLDIKISGGASWLYNFFIGLLQGVIQSAIEQALTQEVTSAIDTYVNQVLSTLPITQPINSQVEIDYELLYSPSFSSNYVTLPELGEFYNSANPMECPPHYCPSNGDLPQSLNSDMLQMIIGDYVANSASYVFFNLGELNMYVTSADVPPSAPIGLNTTDWKNILPQLYEVFPDLLMELYLNCTDVPKGVFTSDGCMMSAVGDLAFEVILSDGSVRNAFTLRGAAAAVGEAQLTGTTLYGTLTYINSTFSLLNSNIGDFDSTILIKLVTLFLADGVVPAVNKQLATGIVLPTVPGVTFEDPSLVWGEGYLGITTDFQYTPPN